MIAWRNLRVMFSMRLGIRVWLWLPTRYRASSAHLTAYLQQVKVAMHAKRSCYASGYLTGGAWGGHTVHVWAHLPTRRPRGRTCSWASSSGRRSCAAWSRSPSLCRLSRAGQEEAKYIETRERPSLVICEKANCDCCKKRLKHIL